VKAIVMLFTNKIKTDSKEYVYPNIEKVRVTVEGVPNAVYSQGIPKTRLYEEARRLFIRSEGAGETRTQNPEYWWKLQTKLQPQRCVSHVRSFRWCIGIEKGQLNGVQYLF
jgi:hypothetical protein